MTPPTRQLIAAATLALLAGSASAQADTGSLAGWTVLGDVVVQTGAIVLTTAYAESGDPDQPFNLSGNSAADITLVEAAAGLPTYALDLPEPEYGREGSLVAQSFTVAAGDTLRFNWSFSTLEDQFQDHAFAVVDGQVYTLATAGTPGLATQAFAYSFASAGTATLALGVIDTGDFLGVSTLSVSSLTVTAVPEPATLALWLAGLGVVSAVARRRR
ncbi:MAG: PEP-CTERM sorting domain-containing protein [Rubrivivax sp.]|nr:PEP-CTERM sorting domain-containing protein [Rubrivivax sp.]